jgi:hypothetical protein
MIRKTTEMLLRNRMKSRTPPMLCAISLLIAGMTRRSFSLRERKKGGSGGDNSNFLFERM